MAEAMKSASAKDSDVRDRTPDPKIVKAQEERKKALDELKPKGINLQVKDEAVVFPDEMTITLKGTQVEDLMWDRNGAFALLRETIREEYEKKLGELSQPDKPKPTATSTSGMRGR